MSLSAKGEAQAAAVGPTVVNSCSTWDAKKTMIESTCQVRYVNVFDSLKRTKPGDIGES